MGSQDKGGAVRMLASSGAPSSGITPEKLAVMQSLCFAVGLLFMPSVVPCSTMQAVKLQREG